MPAKTLSAEEANRLIIAALVQSKTSAANAASVAKALVGAELAGQAGHGLLRVSSYCAHAAVGKVDGFAQPVLTQVRPASIAIDAANGFAYPALDLAIAKLPDVVRRQGIAAAGIRRSHHAGVVGLHVEALARQGIVAIMVANSPPAMAPWGGNRPLFGTNPIAFAAPLAGADPIVIDISLSRVARGKVAAAARKGDAIPENWAFDADGQPTTDPKAAMAGTMAPMGDAKGATLALMVELLCAGLTGANYAYDASSFFDDQGRPPGVGQMLIGIEAGAFTEGTLARFADMASAIADTPGARLPGRRRQAVTQEREATGIPVDEAVLTAIQDIARQA